MSNIFLAKDLKKLTIQLLLATGVNPNDAITVAKVLTAADLEGVSSHGITRLPIYLERLQKGLINKNPKIKIDFKFPALATLDADNALGHVAAYKAMREVIKTAQKTGIAAIGVKNSNHFGAAAYYSNMALKKGLIGLVISNGPPAIPPWGGREAYFGTNPLALSIPGGELGPITIDMATSIVARGKIIKAAQEGKSIDLGWALDQEGRVTQDAKAALAGCILPMGGAKGAAIALAIEVLAGLITGAGFGKEVIWQYSNSPEPSNVGHLFVAINPGGFMTKEELETRMGKLVMELKNLPKAKGFKEIRLPGERKRKLAQLNKREGIVIEDTLSEKLREFSKQLDVPFPLYKK